MLGIWVIRPPALGLHKILGIIEIHTGPHRATPAHTGPHPATPPQKNALNTHTDPHRP